VEPKSRGTLSIALIALGAVIALFYLLHYLISDCVAGCMSKGARAFTYALVALGVGLVAAGAVLPRGGRFASAAGLVAGGVVCAAWSVYALTTAERGGVWASAAVGVAAATAGGLLLVPGQAPTSRP
jgi:hypothetical protein